MFNVVEYTTKKFYMLERLEKLADKSSLGKNIAVQIEDDKKRLQEILTMCGMAVSKMFDIPEVTPEIFDEYEFTLVVKKKETNDSIIFGGKV